MGSRNPQNPNEGHPPMAPNADSCNTPLNGYGLETHGISNSDKVNWNLPSVRLVEIAVARGEGYLASTGSHGRPNGPLYGAHAPRTSIPWSSPARRKIFGGDRSTSPSSPRVSNVLFSKVRAYLQQKELFVFDGFVGGDVRPPAGCSGHYRKGMAQSLRSHAFHPADLRGAQIA